MAFTRALLKTLGLSEDQVQSVIDAHLEVVNPLKEERDRLKVEAEKLPSITKQRDEYKAIVDKGDYEAEHKAFEEYKAKVAQDAEQANVKAAYRKLLNDCKISDKRLDAIIKVTDFNGMALDKDGNLKDADKLRDAIKSDWGEFITETHEKGANVETPLDTGNKPARTKAEIMAIKDTAERQKAIADNHQLFGY